MSDIQLATTSNSMKMVVFMLSNEEYCIPIESVREIIRKPEITPLPNAPEFILGVINLRGMIIPILSLNERFGVVTEIGEDAKIVIAESENVVMGIEVDDVNEVLDLSPSQISETPPMSTSIDHEFITGVGKLGERLLVMLNPTALLGDHQMEDPEDLDHSSRGV